MRKLQNLAVVKQIVDKAKSEGKTIVFTNGCFDILHVGHIRCLKDAKSLGDILVVGVNSDSSVAANKGEGTLFYPEGERAEILEAIEFVDYIVVFSDNTVDNVLLELKPHIHAKGTDYTPDTVPEAPAVLSYGGKIAIVGDPKNHSSSKIKAEIVSRKTASV